MPLWLGERRLINISLTTVSIWRYMGFNFVLFVGVIQSIPGEIYEASEYYCRSDHYMYARYGIPVAFFSTGGHPDYHQLTDEPQYIDYQHMAQVVNYVHDLVLAVANLDHRIVVDKPKPDPKGQCVQ